MTKVKKLAVLAVAAAPLLLAGCGGSATQEAVSTPTATSLARASSPVATPTVTTSAASGWVAAELVKQPQDQGAQEISTLPTAVQRSEADFDFLNALKDAKVEVTGIEDPLLATGKGFCAAQKNGTVDNTPQLVAGQLLAQGRVAADTNPDSLAAMIQQAAQKALC